jgi:hypothetical protein
MLEGIFGNENAEKALLHIYHYGEIHASAIAKDYGVALTPIKNQLERFENAGILVAKQIGKARVYSFNQKSPFSSPVKEIIKIMYESLSLNSKQKIFSERRRPRRKGKPVPKKNCNRI